MAKKGELFDDEEERLIELSSEAQYRTHKRIEKEKDDAAAEKAAKEKEEADKAAAEAAKKKKGFKIL